MGNVYLVLAISGTRKRIFWVVMLCLATGVLLTDLVFLGRVYFSYPVAVKVRLEREEGLVFPAVTVCNLNPVRSSKWNKYFASADGTGHRRVKRAAYGKKVKLRVSEFMGEHLYIPILH